MFLGGLTIAINGFTMVFWCCYHRFQWFSMVPDHWSNDAMVSMDRCGLDDTYVPANLLSMSIMTFPMLSLYKEKNSRTYYYWYLWWMGAFCAFSGSEKISPLSTNLFHLCQCQFLEFPICLKTAAACMSSCTSTNDSSSQHCHQIENQGNHVNKQRYRSQLFSNPW